MFNGYFFAGCLVWGAAAWILYCLRTKSSLHSMTLEKTGPSHRIVLLAVLIPTILVCTLPMGLSPSWNGKEPLHRNQYELMAEAILDGRLYFDYDDVDPRLLEMENPYDPSARSGQGIGFHWDHAFYEGKYYMYFGVVPVFLLFLPYRALTGASLTTYHGTQIFAALFICGIFAVFYLLSRKFFKQITFGMYVLLSAAFAVMSIWYSVDAPALYCTAIISALCMEIWSLYFFIRAVWIEEDEKKQIISAFFGSLCGALAFGCRPSIALANLLVIPMLAVYLQNKKKEFRLLRQLLFAASPYIVVGILLMVYNYVRFDSPFEFGQAYQLTLADQSSYGNFFEEFDLAKALNGILTNYISFSSISSEFPYISFNGAWVNFPVLFFTVIALARAEVRNKLREAHLHYFAGVLLFLPVIITVIDVMWTPFLLERYRMDIYWLMGLLCYILAGFYYSHVPGLPRRKFSRTMTVWAAATLGTCFLLFMVPYDNNYTGRFPEKLESVRKVIEFGRNAG